MNYKREAGRRIKAAREGKRLTLKELSRLTGGVLSESRISNYEQGLRMVGIKEAIALSHVLGVEPAHLLCVDAGEGEEMTSQEKQLLRDFQALPERDRNDYARRISVLAMAYKEAVPDERLSPEVRRGPTRKTPQKS